MSVWTQHLSQLDLDAASAPQAGRASATPKITRDVRIMVFTWNVGHAAPSAEQLKEWLPQNGEGLDLLIVATQENAYVVKKDKGTSPRGAASPRGKERRSVIDNNDPDEDDADEDEGRATADETSRRYKFRRRPWVWRKLEKVLKRSHKSSTGGADWATMLCCGKNLCGRTEKHEHWELLILKRLNEGASTRWGGKGHRREWRVCKHSVLAEMRLTIYERCGTVERRSSTVVEGDGRGSVDARASVGAEASRASELGRISEASVSEASTHAELPPLRISEASQAEPMPSPPRYSQLSVRGARFLRRGSTSSSFVRPLHTVSVAHRDRVALGKGGLLANKGGLAIEIKIAGTPLLIIATHLAAHDHAVAKRNKQACEVLSELSRRSKLGLARESSGYGQSHMQPPPYLT